MRRHGSHSCSLGDCCDKHQSGTVGWSSLKVSELKEKGSVGEKHGLIGDLQQLEGHSFAINLQFAQAE